MNEDIYGLQASGIDPEIAAQMLGVKRRRDVALALQKQSMGGLSQTPTPAGGFAVRNHPLEAVAKIVQAYMANQGLESADKEQAKLASANQQKVADAMAMYEQKRAGSPAQSPLTPSDDEGNAMPQVSATPGDPSAALRSGMSNPLIANSPLLKMDQARSAPIHVKADESLVTLDDKNVPKTIMQAPKTFTPKAPLIEHNFPVGNNQVQSHISKDEGVTWTPLPGSKPVDKFNPRPTTQVNVNTAAEKAGAVEMAKNDADFVKTRREAATSAKQTLNVLDRMERAVQSDKTANGLGAETIGALQNVAVTLGDKTLAQNASSNEQYLTDVAELVRGKIKALGSGTAISNTDLLFTKQSMPELAKTREGKMKILDAMKKDLQYIDKEAKSAETHFRSNKGSLSGWDGIKSDTNSGWSIVK